jgi:glycosyltransferase involved in cell wall biosynthesis
MFRLAIHSPRIEHRVVSMTGPGWYTSKLRDRGIKVDHLNWTLASAVPATLRLRSLIAGSGADIVQTWMYRANLFAGMAARAAGRPVVWNIRCSSLDPLRLQSRLAARVGGALARWLPKFVINCSAQSAELHANWGYDAVEGRVIANGYDPELFYPDGKARAETRRSLGFEDGQFVVGTVGRWHSQKGFPVLLRAARLLRDRGVDFRLVMIGRGLDDSNCELEHLIREHGCESIVHLLGERADIPELDRALDLHVLASIGAEGFPNVVAETMLSGTPNVVTDVGDSALIVSDTGWVGPPGDSERLADATEVAFRERQSSPEQWRNRRERARRRIVNNFSIERMARAYEEVWRTVAAAADSDRGKVG